MVGWSIRVRLFCAALMVFSTVVAVSPADAQSDVCVNPPTVTQPGPQARQVSHPRYEENPVYLVKLRPGPDMSCESGSDRVEDNFPVDLLGSHSNGWSLVGYNLNGTNKRGWVETEFVESRAGSTPAATGDEFTVIESPEGYTTLGVRSEPVRTSPNEANVVAWLSTGDSVTRNSTQGEWSNITTTEGTTGWVETGRLAANGGGTSPTTGEFRVNVSPEGYTTLGLRSEPVRTSPNEANVVAWLTSGDTVNRTETQGEWSFITAPDGTQGWTETARLDPTGNNGGGSNPGSGSGSEIPPLNDDGTPIVIFDTDMGPDIDDALALAMVHEYANRGMAQLAAVTLSRNSDTGARYNDAVNTFYCRPNIPIGVYRGSTPHDGSEDGFTRDMIGRYPYNLDMSTVREGHLVMRDVLEAAPDNSVVIIQVGFSTNTARLLEEYPDLVARKARLLSVMGGDNQRSEPRFNISNAPYAAQKVFADWPTTLIQSEFQLGNAIHYPLSSIANDFNYQSNHIIKDSYMAPDYPDEMEWHPARGSHYDMRSWDLTSVIAAIEDPSDYFSPLSRGRVSVDPNTAYTSFQAGSGDHYVLGMASGMSESQKQRIIDRMTELTSGQPHCGGTNPPSTDPPPTSEPPTSEPPPTQTPNGCPSGGGYPADLTRVVITDTPLYSMPSDDPTCGSISYGTVYAGQTADIVETTTDFFRLRNLGWIKQSATDSGPPDAEPPPTTETPPWCPEGYQNPGPFDERVDDLDGYVQPFTLDRRDQRMMLVEPTVAVNAACTETTDIRSGTVVVPVTLAANAIGIDYGGERLYVPAGSTEVISSRPAAAIGFCSGGSGGVVVGGGGSGCIWVDENGRTAENYNANIGFHSPGAGFQAGPVWATGISSLEDIGGVSSCIDVSAGLFLSFGSFMCASLQSQAVVHGVAGGVDVTGLNLDNLLQYDDTSRFGLSGSVTLGLGTVTVKTGDRAQQIREQVCGRHLEFTSPNDLHRFCPTTDGNTGANPGIDNYPEDVLT